jgi:uncharacterized protein
MWHKNRLQSILSNAAISWVALGSLLFLAACTAPTQAKSQQFVGAQSAVLAQQASAIPQTSAVLPRSITVVGEGSVKIKPDVARANLGVETQSETVKGATSEATATIDKVVAALKAQGIAETDIQTSGYSLWTDRSSGPAGQGAEKITYRANNNVTIVIRDLGKVGTILDAAVNAGANAIQGISFGLDDPRKLASQAREKATADALAKAKELAQLNGVEVGDVVSVSEVVGTGGGYYNSNFGALNAPKAGLGGGIGSVNPGELELSLSLQVVYAIR